MTLDGETWLIRVIGAPIAQVKCPAGMTAPAVPPLIATARTSAGPSMHRVVQAHMLRFCLDA